MVPTIEARRGPAHRHSTPDGLVYIHPLTEETFFSVTTALDGREGEELAKRWRPGLSAKAAFAELPRLVAASRIPACGRTNLRCTDHPYTEACVNCGCGDCKDCMVKWLTYRHFAESSRRSQEGIELHDWIEGWVLSGGRKNMDVRDEVRPYVLTFLQFVADMGLTPDSWELAEATILNRTDGWGGTLDAHLRFDAEATPAAYKLCRKFGCAKPLTTADFKSRERSTAAFYPNHAKQLSAYERGQVVLLKDGRELPLPRTDGGLVIQLRPDGYGWRRVDTSDACYAEFLRNLASLRWDVEHGDAATQVKTFPDLDIPGVAAPTKARAARKHAVPNVRTATAAATKPAKKAAAPHATARRTVAESLGIAPNGRPIDPASPFGDDLPF